MAARIEKARFVRQNDYTIAFVSYDDGSTGVGVSKCNREAGDKYDHKVGKRLALSRATPRKNLNVVVW